MEFFNATCEYKLIYVFNTPYDDHKGLLKIGETKLKTNKNWEDLPPNCRDLNRAAHDRIGQETGTFGAKYTLLYTEIAVKKVGNYMSPFGDGDVHRMLRAAGVKQVIPNPDQQKKGIEWYETNLETVKEAIRAIKEGKTHISTYIEDENEPYEKITFREEQIDAVERTMKVFKKKKDMLWYAKMRFGKTISALEVVRRSQYRRVIIVTHRPVVDDGWNEDFKKIFFKGNSENEYIYAKKTKDPTYIYDEKTDLENDIKIQNLDRSGDHFIYFASLQDLRGSKIVGGNFNKNNAVFALDWDLVILDEAHEGTQTELGGNVIQKLRKKNTKLLALSGTPFNLLGQYEEDNTYVWDYVMEQKAKAEWDKTHPGEPNPYADLPKMNIYTYDLSNTLKKYVTDEYDSKAFNFREFFRVWYKGPNGQRKLPEGAVEGKFVHEDDVRRFLDLLTQDSKETGYPYSTEIYRDMFRHTLWIVPGVKEARALSALLKKHPVFRFFGIANVAGEGDTYEEDHSPEALELVRDTIKNHDYSITLSCGKLTTGVTVKEWTAVLMLAGSYSTAASQYMQTIFRVQSAGSVNGKQKTNCYVFDFAPDRALKVLTESANLSRRPEKDQKEERESMQEFLNFCPVIAISGSKTKEYSVSAMMQKVKQIYAVRAVNSGFSDNSLYNDNLLNLTELDAKKFKDLKAIIGKANPGEGKKMEDVVVNNQGLNKQKKKDDVENKPKRKELNEEEKRRKEAQEARRAAISILRSISIRIPLLIYGADVPLTEDIDVRRFVDLVDNESWNEFMPKGVTKKLFLEYEKYYDMDVFIAAGRDIRRRVLEADAETPTDRIRKLVEIFRTFRNPDKETVLTPWRVVNLHMAQTLGGWCFYDQTLEDDIPGIRHSLDEPRFVDNGEVTKDVFNDKAKILEINSKTGLYPLYVAYSFYRQAMEGMTDEDWSPEECLEFWDEVVKNNVFVICKTPMAKSITKRTLCGYRDIDYNAHCFDDIVNTLKNKPEQFKKRVLRGKFWNKEEVKKMEFAAVVGNPPYQDSTTTNNRQGAIYNYFYDAAQGLSRRYTLISPARFLFNTGLTPQRWNKKMLSDPHVHIAHFEENASMIFPNTEIKGGIVIIEYDAKKSFGAINEFVPDKNLQKILSHFTKSDSNLPAIIYGGRSDLKFNSQFVKDYPQSIQDRINAISKNHSEVVKLSQNEEYELKSSTFDVLPYAFKEKEPDNLDQYYKLIGVSNGTRCSRWIERKYMTPRYPENNNVLNYKVIVPEANGNGKFGEVLSSPLIIGPGESATPTFISIGSFNNVSEAENLLKYIKTKLARALWGVLKKTQHNSASTWAYVPLQDFSDKSDIDWNQSIKDIDAQLYKKYNLSEDEIAYIEENVRPME